MKFGPPWHDHDFVDRQLAMLQQQLQLRNAISERIDAQRDVVIERLNLYRFFALIGAAVAVTVPFYVWVVATRDDLTGLGLAAVLLVVVYGFLTWAAAGLFPKASESNLGSWWHRVAVDESALWESLIGDRFGDEPAVMLFTSHPAVSGHLARYIAEAGLTAQDLETAALLVAEGSTLTVAQLVSTVISLR